MIINIVVVLMFAGLLFFVHLPFMGLLLNVLAALSIILGLLFFTGTTLGLLRFPDFYTRMHAAGKGDTLSSILILFGCALFSLNQGHLNLATILVGMKILLIVNFIFIGSPTATHALIEAGYNSEVEPWENKE